MVNPTTLSMAARALREHLDANTDLTAANILFGHPASVQHSNGDEPYLSVYFYHVYPAGNTADLRSEEPLDTIVHCIMTPLAKGSINSPNQVSPGEEDLRVLGQVMTCMHAERLLIVTNANGDPVCNVEIIPLDLSVDQLSKIIPTQPAGGFRSTVAYELSLIPLFSKKVPPVESEVKMVTYGVSTDMKDGKDDGKHFPQRYIKAIAEAHQNLGKNDPWKPQLYLTDEEGRQSFFRQVVTNQDKMEFALLAIGPEKGIVLTGDEKKLKVIAEYWFPESGSFTVKREETITLEEPTGDWNNFHANIVWELDTQLTGQYLFRVARSVDSQEDIEGNLCLIVIVRGELK